MTLIAAQTYANVSAASALSSANTYTDISSAATLPRGRLMPMVWRSDIAPPTLLHNYANSVGASTLAAANNYSDISSAATLTARTLYRHGHCRDVNQRQDLRRWGRRLDADRG